MHTTTRTRPSSRRRWNRTVAAVGLATAAALASVAVPTAARADLVPCDVFDPACDPLEYDPPRYLAIGTDRDLPDAQAEAEAEAAAHCPGGAFDRIKVRPVQLPTGVWEYRLTYACG